MELDDLEAILRLIEERESITEFELEKDGVKVRIKKGAVTAPPVGPVVPAVPAGAPSPATVLPAAAVETVATPAAAELPGADNGVHVVSSPIVGTFYRAADPDSQPFVEVGAHVSEGQVLCIVEAMKLMNEIEADRGGEIVTIHVENGQPVQFGDPLFSIRPA